MSLPHGVLQRGGQKPGKLSLRLNFWPTVMLHLDFYELHFLFKCYVDTLKKIIMLNLAILRLASLRDPEKTASHGTGFKNVAFAAATE